MSSNSSNTISKSKGVAIPPWRSVLHTQSQKFQTSSSSWSSFETLLPDPTHISPFLYPALPLTRNRKRKKYISYNSDLCVLEDPVRSASQSLTMGWSFRMQLEQLDRQREPDDSEDDDQVENECWEPESSSNKLPVTSVRTGIIEAKSLSHSPTNSHPSASSCSPPHSSRLVSRPQPGTDVTRQGSRANHSYTPPKPNTARMHHGYKTILIDRRRSRGSSSPDSSAIPFRNQATSTRRAVSDSCSSSHSSSDSSASANPFRIQATPIRRRTTSDTCSFSHSSLDSSTSTTPFRNQATPIRRHTSDSCSSSSSRLSILNILNPDPSM
ncbi:hypothetical protein DFJ43DRAFT_111223 [Lentinula guzmanii]|uniref:Uncharacterized protein n=1 Tax=Lentinula guzmanii TaxID=2804957 RepID=A0AA38JT67_9AGAR|nr:hypothetical protein DFJ43DRAFT_111223 [Lentinula guzmanii]